ncbi:MAG: DUF5688 family protein [Blautia sp.]
MSPPRIFMWEKLFYNPDYDGENFMSPDHELVMEKNSIGICLSTARRTNGAIAIFLPGVARRLAELLEGDYFIVFTSIHEVMIHSVGTRLSGGSGECFAADVAGGHSKRGLSHK